MSVFTQNLTAQLANQPAKETPVDFFAGFIIAPSAATTFDDDPVFSTSTTLFFTTVMVKGDWSFAPYYNLSSNNVGV